MELSGNMDQDLENIYDDSGKFSRLQKENDLPLIMAMVNMPD